MLPVLVVSYYRCSRLTPRSHAETGKLTQPFPAFQNKICFNNNTRSKNGSFPRFLGVDMKDELVNFPVSDDGMNIFTLYS